MGKVRGSLPILPANPWLAIPSEKIKNLFPDGSLSSATKLVLVNTVYFKGQWDTEFKKENTKEEEFWLNKGTSKSVLMMKQHHSFKFTFLEDLQAKILGIPYKGKDLSMFVLLPNDIDGLEKIIDKVTPEKLIEWTSPRHLEEKNVNLSLPRFEVEDTYDLAAALAALGMADVFSEQAADFSAMSARSGLHAQSFLHSSWMVVTEGGTEAAAATGMGLASTSAGGFENVHCNHPFLFFVRHNETDSILFFGRFSSP
ncbi:serpin B13 isoform X7 [Choloepus didactylus]|uniref:serpin B13 isoform X7 n=1 Tax=Choloepus didactylus TaxID=27675 RepID=UPI00189E30B5|nr:serpin B13 isoform X7 [Choloepus didactylus]